MRGTIASVGPAAVAGSALGSSELNPTPRRERRRDPSAFHARVPPRGTAEDHRAAAAAAHRPDQDFRIEVYAVDLLPSILRLRTEGRGPKTEFPLHGIGQFVRQDPQVRHLSHDPVRFGQMNDPFLTRLAVEQLLCLAKDIRPDQLLPSVVLTNTAVGPRLLAAHQGRIARSMAPPHRSSG